VKTIQKGRWKEKKYVSEGYRAVKAIVKRLVNGKLSGMTRRFGVPWGL
jgi:hypothetical protein